MWAAPSTLCPSICFHSQIETLNVYGAARRTVDAEHVYGLHGTVELQGPFVGLHWSEASTAHPPWPTWPACRPVPCPLHGRLTMWACTPASTTLSRFKDAPARCCNAQPRARAAPTVSVARPPPNKSNIRVACLTGHVTLVLIMIGGGRATFTMSTARARGWAHMVNRPRMGLRKRQCTQLPDRVPCPRHPPCAKLAPTLRQACAKICSKFCVKLARCVRRNPKM